MRSKDIAIWKGNIFINAVFEKYNIYSTIIYPWKNIRIQKYDIHNLLYFWIDFMFLNLDKYKLCYFTEFF
jgi:hypothetical protein